MCVGVRLALAARGVEEKSGKGASPPRGGYLSFSPVFVRGAAPLAFTCVNKLKLTV